MGGSQQGLTHCLKVILTFKSLQQYCEGLQSSLPAPHIHPDREKRKKTKREKQTNEQTTPPRHEKSPGSSWRRAFGLTDCKPGTGLPVIHYIAAALFLIAVLLQGHPALLSVLSERLAAPDMHVLIIEHFPVCNRHAKRNRSASFNCSRTTARSFANGQWPTTMANNTVHLTADIMA